MILFKAIWTQAHLIKKLSFLAFFAFGFIPISSALGQITFAPKVDYTTGLNPNTVFAADLDGDGDQDLAVGSIGNITTLFFSAISIFMNNGDGTFAAKVDYNEGNASGASSLVSVADLDGDGDQDLVAINSDKTLSVLMNNGDGTFATKVDYGTGGRPTSVFAADLDGDGDQDLAVTHRFSSAIAVLMNNGDGTFAANVDYGTENNPTFCIAADLDGDGDQDLAVTYIAIATVSVLKNNGDGTFAAKVDYSLAQFALSVIASDLDNDGDLDLAVPFFSGATISVLNNNGDGTFATAVDLGIGLFGGAKVVRVFAADFDGDGDEELGVVHIGKVSISENNGDGTFAPPIFFPTGLNPFWPFAADLDGDGDQDLAISNASNDNVSILINITIRTVIEVALDIKPRSCPNPLNVRETGPGAWSILIDQPTDNLGKNTPRALENSKSVVPVAILGSVELDVTDIDVSSVALEGVAPVRSSLSDVSSPPADTGPCACSDAGGDGFNDLTLKFDKWALVEALGEVQNRDTVQLTLTGSLLDGTPIEGFDCVVIIGGATAPSVTSDTEDPGLTSFPNPFNPNTKIGFSLAAPSQVTLEIFNVAGQKITTLVDERLDAGWHTIIWNGTTSNGAKVSSGIYFSRLKVDEVFYAKKMLLVK